MNIELSVIIVNYNGLKYLEGCFAALTRNLAGVAFEIIVLDNNSTDESCAYLKTSFPKIRLIESSLNHGFGKGNNEAVKHARGEYLLLINNDTIVLDQLQPALQLLKSDPGIGVIGINMLNAEQKYIPVAGNFPNARNMFQLVKLLDLGVEFKTGQFKSHTYDVDWLGGSFLMMPKRIFDQIGGFDEDYFMYVEDVDFCKKIADRGYRRVFLPGLRYVHFIGFSNAKNPLLINGYRIYISKHFSGLQKMVCLLALEINKWVKKARTALN